MSVLHVGNENECEQLGGYTHGNALTIIIGRSGE